ncbi:MAG: hypothetical protein ABJF10_15040 [Chthoniobacter sp.]|uniref:hypothetical protein n=1 Tax=Chthoniobacter sp. TaxID=2510640 RepID=UPI0032A8EC6A
MPLPQFLVYCTAEGEFVLSMKGKPETWKFKAIENAVTAARNMQKGASIAVYNATGQVVVDTVT